MKRVSTAATKQSRSAWQGWARSLLEPEGPHLGPGVVESAWLSNWMTLLWPTFNLTTSCLRISCWHSVVRLPVHRQPD